MVTVRYHDTVSVPCKCPKCGHEWEEPDVEVEGECDVDIEPSYNEGYL